MENHMGNKRFWTREKVLVGLAEASAEIRGPLPCCDGVYSQLKSGRLDWPTSHRILEYFGSMARAWLAAGVHRSRVSLKNVDWAPEEDLYLKEHAGKKTLAEIGAHLLRSAASVRTRLNKNLGIHARDNQGLFSAAELAKEYKCPYHRVREALRGKEILGRFDRARHRWQVNLAKLTPAAVAILKAPKRTYKNSPTDMGDYYERYGLQRKNGCIVAKVEG